MAVLKKILFPGMTEAAQIAVTQLTKKADAENAINALTLTSENTGIDADGHPVYTIGLAVDGKTIVKGDNDVLKSGLKLVYHAAKTEGDAEQEAHIALTDVDGKELNVIKVSDIIGNGILKSSSYDPSKGILTLVFDNAGGEDTEVEIDLGALFDFEDIIIKDDSSDYLSFEKVTPAEGDDDEGQAQFGVKLATVTYTAPEGENPSNLSVNTTNGKLLDAEQTITAVKNYVDNKATDLAVEAEGDEYITAEVDSTNNKKINVTADVQDLTATAGNAGTWTVTDAGEASVDGQEAPTLTGIAESLVDGADVAAKVKTYVDGKVAIEVARADAKILAAIKALDVDAVGGEDGDVLTTISETDGKISATKASLSTVKLTGFEANTEKTGAIAATDSVADALNKLQNKADAIQYKVDGTTLEFFGISAKTA